MYMEVWKYGNQIGSDTLENGSDIIQYPTAILSPDPLINSLISRCENLQILNINSYGIPLS